VKHNPPYYHCLLKDAGYESEQGWVDYKIRVRPELVARWESALEASRRAGYKIVPLSALELAKRNRLFTEVWNECFAKHWGYSPFILEEIEHLFSSMEPTGCLDTSLFAFQGDEPVGVLWVVPEITMTARRFDPATTALLVCDLQNDYLHPDGAYARGGATSEAIAAVPARVKVAADALRRAGGWIVSTQFTLVPGKGGEPLISPHLRRLRPFLRKGDFAPGAWGHDLLDALKPADLMVEKIAQSAFYMSRLEFVLRKAGIATLAICGIVTNGGVASTVRDAHVREFRCILLTDGCAAFDPRVHETTVADLATICATTTCAELAAALAEHRAEG